MPAAEFLLRLPEIRLCLFKQLRQRELMPLRLVCKAWDQSAKEAMAQAENVRIVLDFPLLDIPTEYDYEAKDKEHMLVLLERHIKVRDLALLNGQPLPVEVGRLANPFGRMANLQRLELYRFSLDLTTVAKLREKSSLSSLVLNFCQLNSSTLGQVPESIRDIVLNECSIREEDILIAIQNIHRRGIPLRKLIVNSVHKFPHFVPLVQFMLENFSSLRILEVSGTVFRHLPRSFNYIQRMAAVNIEKLSLCGMDWPSKEHHQQFFGILFAQPLSRLTSFSNIGSNIPLNETIIDFIWLMCPSLKKMLVKQPCGAPGCGDPNFACKGLKHIARLSRPSNPAG